MAIKENRSKQLSWVDNHKEDEKIAQRRMKYNILGIAILLIMFLCYLLKIM